MKINVDRDESKRENYVYSHQALTFSLLLSKAAIRGVLQKKVFLEISQNSQENICARVSFLIRLQAPAFFAEHLWTTACFVLTQKCYFFSWFNSIVDNVKLLTNNVRKRYKTT